MVKMSFLPLAIFSSKTTFFLEEKDTLLRLLTIRMALVCITVE